MCVVDDEIELTLAAKSVDRGHLAAAGRGGAGNGSYVLNASILTVFRLISLSVGLWQRTRRSACMYMRAQW